MLLAFHYVYSNGLQMMSFSGSENMSHTWFTCLDQKYHLRFLCFYLYMSGRKMSELRLIEYGEPAHFSLIETKHLRSSTPLIKRLWNLIKVSLVYKLKPGRVLLNKIQFKPVASSPAQVRGLLICLRVLDEIWIINSFQKE